MYVYIYIYMYVYLPPSYTPHTPLPSIPPIPLYITQVNGERQSRKAKEFNDKYSKDLVATKRKLEAAEAKSVSLEGKMKVYTIHIYYILHAIYCYMNMI
jgi:hypothetical protein